MAVDNPARQTFVLELVGPDLLTNAITLNSVTINVARVVGPTMAAGAIAGFGIATCFYLNAASFLAVVVALLAMRRSELLPMARAERTKGQVREGLRYVWDTPSLRTPLIMMTIIGMLSYEFQVFLPILAKQTFHGGASVYGILSAAMGLGAIVGGLVTAGKTGSGLLELSKIALVLGSLILVVALSPTLVTALAALVAVGAASIVFLARANTTMQLGSEPSMRGRVMALWTVAFLRTTPIGGPIIGWIGQHIGARWAVVTSGSACVAAAAFGFWSLRSDARASQVEPVAVSVDRAPAA
jgi:MFS family permease